MSENSTPEERTELPTARRMDELRKKGTVHVSTEVTQVLSLATAFLALAAMMQYLLSSMKLILTKSYSLISQREPFTAEALEQGFLSLLAWIGPQVALLVGVTAVVAVLVTMLQTEWCVKEKKFEFQWNLLNPVNGVRRIFSIQGFVTTLKAFLKLCIVLPLGYYALRDFAPEMIQLIHLTVADIGRYTGASINTLFWRILYIFIAFAAFDYFYTRYLWFRQNKMTKEEVKDEHKMVEGDETTKRRIQAKGLQRVMQRIKTAVPKADVVVTNPTHYAVALKYDRGTMAAPVVVAKGADHLALRIREIARESGVPVLERKLLARALYGSTEVGSTIPRELFKAVAEVLAYVFRLRNPQHQTTRM